MLRFFPEKNKTFQEEQEYTFDSELPVPKHIAIIMDGKDVGHKIADCPG